jgi:hypothetical protein
MPPRIEDVRHDAAALHRFIDSIASDCKIAEGYPSYAESSTEFFKYIRSLAEKTKAYLKRFVDGLDPKLAVDDPQDFCDRTQIIRNLRLNWFQLHELIKPALDADTLHVPCPLVNALTTRFQMIKGFESKRFVVLHTNQLNYFQISGSWVRRSASDIAAFVKDDPPDFDNNLGIIALPYSQSSSIFLNFALAHEMGHFAFQERAEAEKIRPAIVKSLLTVAAGKALDLRDHEWCRDQVLDWCEEIYCDLFALWLIGPCFSFSFIEIFGLSRLSSSVALAGESLPPIAKAANFADSHPSMAFRIGEHVRFLKSKELGWWDEINKKVEDGPKDRPSHYLTLMAEAEGLPKETFKFDSQFKPKLSQIILGTFLQAVGEVSRVVKETFANVPSETGFYHDQHGVIEKYLSFGVVPSRLVFPDGTDQSPNIVALLNAANLFYLERLDLLIDQIDDGRPDCLECRAFWAERVEMWTSKALEDIAG